MADLDVTAMFRALGDPTRKRILEFLCQRSEPVALEEGGEVRPIQGVSVGDVCCHVTGGERSSSTVSFHIKELRLAGLIAAEKSGKYMVCSARRDSITAMIDYLAVISSTESSDCNATAVPNRG